jgi:hypothetical protein
MERLNRRWIVLFGVAALLAATAPAASASDPAPAAQRAPAAAEPATDPALRALLLGLAASMLREAAASPDPLNALGDSLERKLMSALRSPEASRLMEALLAQAFRDAPEELREPLTLFAGSMLDSVRRELLEERRPRRRDR